MNSLQENQSDLEVILDFLEEYYRQNAKDHSRNADDVYWTRSVSVDETTCEEHWGGGEAFSTKPLFHQVTPRDADASIRHIAAALSGHETGTPASAPAARQPPLPRPAAASGSGRKTRLFHFLFEVLEDPGMAHCVSWVPANVGVFRFSSMNKDQVAALWGQRKGNKRPMTYQKMSRALRNYARSGEIFKVKKKLTYQFSGDTLRALQQRRRQGEA